MKIRKAILTAGVNILMANGMLPLIAVFIEPAKVLFLNNAINHGIFTPIATGYQTVFLSYRFLCTRAYK